MNRKELLYIILGGVGIILWGLFWLIFLTWAVEVGLHHPVPG